MRTTTSPIKEPGLRARLALRTKTARSTITQIFAGKRRATLRQAAALEEEFVKRNIPLNRWDLLYGVKEGESLEQYLQTKEAAE